MPSEWLSVNGSTSRPPVHSNEVSTWLPKLRTLTLGGNNIAMPVYQALQSVIGLASLQVLDLSGNALTGELEGSFEMLYCDGASLDACDSATTAVKTGASLMAIVLLASNSIEGGLEEAHALPRSLSVFSVSGNLLEGPVPEDYSRLSVFFAGEETNKSARRLPLRLSLLS